MDRSDASPALGLAASVATIALVLVPYVLPTLSAADVADYYEYGVLGGWSVLVVATVAVVVFAAVLADRTDPATAAGAILGLGIAALLLALYWAATIEPDAIGIPDSTLFAYHRWTVVGAAGAIALAGVLLTAEQDLF